MRGAMQGYQRGCKCFNAVFG